MIQKLTEKDLHCWAQMAADVYDSSVAEMLKEYEAGVYSNQFQNEYMYWHNNEIAGFISLTLRYDYVNGCETSPVGYVEGIYIKPTFRKMHIGAELIDFAKQWAKEKDATELASDCLIDNLDSLHFHEAVGFEEKERVICFAMKI